MKNSIFLLIFALTMFISSCKTTNNCEHMCNHEEVEFIIEDTFFIPGAHIHFEGECSWTLDKHFVFRDTIKILMPINNEMVRCKK